MAMGQPIQMPACCADPANRATVAIEDAVLAAAAERGAVPSREQCRVCGRNHYTLAPKPVHFGVTGHAMGGRA